MAREYNSAIERVWRESDSICAFADSERHLGHVVKLEVWHAYDATHPNSTDSGPNYLGGFFDLKSAKRAVESAVVGGARTMRARAH